MRRGLPVVLLMAFLLLPPGGPFAQEAQKVVDGTIWKQLTAENKAVFTLGYATGIGVFAKFAPGPCGACPEDCLDDVSKRLVPLGTAIPQVVQLLDKIYEDQANLAIPVQWAMKLAAQKTKGVSEEEWKAAIAEARAGSAPAKTTP